MLFWLIDATMGASFNINYLFLETTTTTKLKGSIINYTFSFK